MLFNSLPYLVFLPIVVFIYYVLNPRFRWILLLFASYFFYGYLNAEFLILIAISTLVDYVASNLIQKSTAKWWRRVLLGISVTTNLGILFLFKYLKLFLPPREMMFMSIKAAEMPLRGALDYALYLVIPVGISFYTFQTMSYTIDVYRRKSTAERHLGKFALFVSFFPQLVAGPIERFSHLRPQLDMKFKFSLANMKDGLRLILFGFFLKLCIADNLVQTVDPVYSNPQLYSSLNILLGTFLFGLQIYGDFAGYTLIAQGSALLLGVRLMDNFKTPYLSGSIHEFWQRWHISLSTWFRDYLYIPLGGNKVAVPRWAINILMVFAVSGFWHGAEWTFLIWGAIHGVFYLVEHVIKKARIRFPGYRLFAGVLTFAVVSIAWVFFRAEDMEAVSRIWTGITSNTGTEQLYFSRFFLLPVLLFIASELLLYNNRFDYWIKDKHTGIRWSVYLCLLFCVLVLGGAVNHPFIYFRF